MRCAATGESIPPDSSAIPRPVTPTGNPPAPGILPADTYAASFIISIEIVSSGALRSTSKPSASCTSPPTARSIFHRVHREALVLALGPHGKGPRLASGRALDCFASDRFDIARRRVAEREILQAENQRGALRRSLVAELVGKSAPAGAARRCAYCRADSRRRCRADSV